MQSVSVESPQKDGITISASTKPSDAIATILGSEILGSLFDPKIFLTTTFVGFLLCCVLGYFAGEQNQFGKIERFGIVLGPQANFYPTFRQLLSYSRSRAMGKKKIFVVVGGSSILNGVGQSSAEVWTKKLQELLGENFAVVNLGLRSCSSYEGAYFVAEALRKKSERVIFVTGSAPGESWHPLGKPTYAHLFWDAKYHNFLYDFPARDMAIASREKALPDTDWTTDQLSELKLSRLSNSLFNFLDLWTAVGYRYIFTLYNPITHLAPFGPLKRLPEIEAYEQFPAPDQVLALDSIRNVSAELYSWNSTTNSWQKNDSAWKKFVETIHQNVVPQMRAHTLVLLLYHNPEYRRLLSVREQRRTELAYDNAEALLKAENMHVVQSGENFVGADYRDTKHLSPSGGAKLATQVADETRGIARTLGYLQ